MNKQELLKEIISYKDEGLGSRKIAKKLGISKSTVNSWYAEYIQCNTVDVKKTKIVLLDIESMPSVVATFGRFKQNISQDAVLREGGWIASYAYKVLGEDEIKGNVLTPDEALHADDSGLCMELFELIEQADVLVAHNLMNFDLPMIKTRMIVNGLPPIRKVKTVDSLLLSREFRFNSNKLDSLCRQLDVGEKMKHSGISLWIECMEGNAESLQTLYEYNKVDIKLLEELYLTIRPYSNRHPNMAMQGDKPRCNICCSDNISKTGNTVSTNLSVFEEVVCNDCGARFKTRQSITTKEERKTFLSN